MSETKRQVQVSRPEERLRGVAAKGMRRKWQQDNYKLHPSVAPPLFPWCTSIGPIYILGGHQDGLCFVLPAADNENNLEMHRVLRTMVVRPRDRFINVFPKHQEEIEKVGCFGLIHCVFFRCGLQHPTEICHPVQGQ